LKIPNMFPCVGTNMGHLPGQDCRLRFPELLNVERLECVASRGVLPSLATTDNTMPSAEGRPHWVQDSVRITSTTPHAWAVCPVALHTRQACCLQVPYSCLPTDSNHVRKLKSPPI
jgi:hypothetical protein